VLRFLSIKLFHAVMTLLLVSIVVFIGIRLLPGDPAQIMAGDNQDPAVIAAYRAELGLDQPMVVQYWHYLVDLVTGNLGMSSSSGRPVAEMIAQTLPVTVQLAAITIVLSVVCGLAFGVAAAYWRGRWPEWLSNGISLLGLSIPNFWLAILAIVYLASAISWLPASGFVPFATDPGGWFLHLIMPALILGTSLCAVVMRQTRSNMIEALGSEYVLASRVKGAGEPRVVVVHALRNSIIVVVTLVGLHAGALLSGAAVIEQIFGLPGVGRLAVNSVFLRDYAVLQGVVMVSAAVYVVINLAVDLLYSVIDPRIRVSGRTA